MTQSSHSFKVHSAIIECIFICFSIPPHGWVNRRQADVGRKNLVAFLPVKYSQFMSISSVYACFGGFIKKYMIRQRWLCWWLTIKGKMILSLIILMNLPVLQLYSFNTTRLTQFYTKFSWFIQCVFNKSKIIFFMPFFLFLFHFQMEFCLFLHSIFLTTNNNFIN